MQEWPILLRDSHAGYITWDEYMTNQNKLRQNKSAGPALERRGPPRNGNGLLQGLVLCGRCGQRMRTRFLGRTNVSYYWCDKEELGYFPGTFCWTVATRAPDEAVVSQFLDVMQPSELDLSLAVVRQAEAQAGEVDKQWQMRLERVRYEVRRAEKRYRTVDPEYRLVARTLEREWEEKLREMAEVEGQYDETKRRQRLVLTEQHRASILALAKDLPRVWHAPSTTNADRKNLLRLVIRDVVLRPVDVPTRMTSIHIHWQTGATTELQIPRPGRGKHIATSHAAVRVIRKMTLEGHSVPDIARRLNEQGLRTGTGLEWTTQRVQAMRSTGKLTRNSTERIPEQDAKGRYSVRGLSKLLGVSNRVIYYWANIGHLKGERRAGRGPWWFSVDEATIHRLRRRTTG
jgi:hypothetical protein